MRKTSNYFGKRLSSKRMGEFEDIVSYGHNFVLQEDGKGSKELKRLQFYGAGPKMAGFDKSSPEDTGKTRGKKVDYSDHDPVSNMGCLILKLVQSLSQSFLNLTVVVIS